ncbi:hypothetical protein [Caulobacter sp. NIBR1757]|uniref:hypothetical protein n=1 Tax=Caulobacter sp. NIBR1757 TaxID=3016000 RepID=UPI0022F053B7|nr:hypothetical protein [Caulobacter sp. NIBR1757]WGM37518.1 hypothetical protein AMEJIAPC_00417 [Caulobacter sp. NIBR1757]
MADHEKILAFIAKSESPSDLKRLINNAEAQGQPEITSAAFRRLVSLVPGEMPGTLEHDFWSSIQAFEQIKSAAAGKTIKLGYTRRMVRDKGIKATLTNWALSTKKTEGFDTLIELGMPELTGEAVVLRHRGDFPVDVIEAATKRLVEAEVDINSVLAG